MYFEMAKKNKSNILIQSNSRVKCLSTLHLIITRWRVDREKTFKLWDVIV